MSNFSQKYYCIIAAAGSGQRMDGTIPKQYYPIAHQTILEYSVQPFLELPLIEQVVVVIAQEDHRFSSLPIARHPKLNAVVGGHERYHSVLAGLKEIAKTAHEDDWILVHDAARPNIAYTDLNRLIKSVGQHPVGGVLGTPICDSLKKIDANHLISQDVQREQMWRAFTPQMFRFGLLKSCLEEALELGLAITDEASALTRKGHPVIMVQGHSDNIKVTTPADYVTMKKLLLSNSLEDHALDTEVEC